MADVGGERVRVAAPTTIGESTGFTGRYIVLYEEQAAETVSRALETEFGVQADIAASAEPTRTGATLFAALGAGVLEVEPRAIEEFSVAGGPAASGILAVEPERILYAISEEQSSYETTAEGLAPGMTGMASRDYIRGYSAGVAAFASSVLQFPSSELPSPAEAVGALSADERDWTWGLQAVGAAPSRHTGSGINVAVLDTGIARSHPDFVGRGITTKSFVRGEAVDDVHGHGTHCAGTIAGSARPSRAPRYGVAPDVNLFVGKVLSNRGSGREGDILDGLNWAVENGCVIISMSLGAPVSPTQPFNVVFEGIAQRARKGGVLIIAAAGNDSRRPGVPKPVSHPANCPSVMAVAALDPRLRVASFSNGGVNPNGGKIDIAGPGVDVLSSYPHLQPNLGPYRRLNGTSMATPHVAGLAALWAEATGVRGHPLWKRLVGAAKATGEPPESVGAGIAVGP